MKFKSLVATLACTAVLFGCGGGGGDAGDPILGGGENPPTAEVSQLRMTLSSSNVSNGTMSDVVATVTALSASSKAVSGVEVEYSVEDQSAQSEEDSAYIDSSVTSTGADGRSTATVNLGTDKSNRVITIRASAGGRSVSKTVTVRGASIDATLTSLVDPATPETIVFTVQDSNGTGISNLPISVEASGLGVRTGTTDNNGSYSYPYTVPNSPGNTVVFTVSAAGVSKQYGVNIKAPSQVLPGPDLSGGVTPALQVNPNVIAVNSAGSETNKMQVVAKFENLARLPIPNMRVSFRLDGLTAAAVGGKFSNGPITGTPVQASDADGKVQTFYIPSTRSSPNNAISIRACYGSTDSEALNCTASMSQAITIADEAVSVTIGTDGALIKEDENLSYAQRFVIKVVNSAGQPKPGLTVSAQINTVNYFKGRYVRGADRWNKTAEVQCAKEDLDDDDRLDSAPVNEDLDFDARLEPIRADVSLTAVNGWVTNDDGVVLVKMSYPKNVASWMTINLQATSLVGGSEGRASRQQLLRALDEDVKAEPAPAFEFSPYGRVTTTETLDAPRLMPNGVTTLPSGTVLLPCQNPD